MAVRTIPVRVGEPHQQVQLELDGIIFQLELRWNARAPAWTLAIRDAGNVVLLEGVRVCYGTLFLPARRPATFPAGELLLVSRDEGMEDPGLGDLGVSALLVYVDASDVAEVEAT